ncbi:spore gernimation protein GerPD [Paenibacillus filicis]|uniref:Spore gernimation protein GerPD n=1 Tax=Paenibacillus gyeongsangnamensis TaxID=3388067 RepID=A0ABT4Q351_9BACL|nr:spore gernimation protein GerPD [Paenibacillus filicis]MCZ8511305.1 spore gernimation protein GerPD [Paenibacillus filicis]
MILQVINKEIAVGQVRIVGVASSAVFQVGDTQEIYLSSIFDTPPESLIIGPMEPIAREGR